MIQCVDEIVRRQEALRTVFFTVAGEFRQLVIHKASAPASIDLSAIPESCRLTVSRRVRRAELRRPFNLKDAPAWRAMVVDLGGGVCELSLTVHHVISDAWSQRILINEFSALAAQYAAGRPSRLAPLPFQYRDYAVWQTKRLHGDHLARLMDAWADLAATADFEPIRLPANAAANGLPRVAYRRFAIRPALQSKLAAACRSRGATLYMLVLAAFQHLLHHVSGSESVTIVASAANRYPREMNDVVGFFAHNFPIASRRRAGDTVFTLLERTRDYLVEALRLQELPFDKIVEAIRRSRADVDPSRLNVSFLMTPAGGDAVSFPGTDVRSRPIDEVDPRFALEMQLSVEDEGIAGTLQYATASLADASADALVAQYLAVLEGVANPESSKSSSRPTAGFRRAVPLAGRSRPAPRSEGSRTWQSPPP